MDQIIAFHFKNDNFSAEEKVIRDGLNDFASKEVGLERQFANVFAYDAEQVIGGVTAHTISKTLSIKLLWVHDDFRGQAIGRILLEKLEAYAVEQGCIVSFVDTMAYQAPEFYLKCGYKETARISEFYVGQDRVFYRKDLTA